jgi:hypothetical protein
MAGLPSEGHRKKAVHSVNCVVLCAISGQARDNQGSFSTVLSALFFQHCPFSTFASTLFILLDPLD